MYKHEDIPNLIDDELITPTIGSWGERKYLLVKNYAQIFANSMKHKWDCRVYIDLFAGGGRSIIEGTSKIVLASPLLAIDIQDKFDIYIFCEQEESKLDALKQRVKRDFSDVEVQYIHGDSNKQVDKILSKIPQHRKGFSVLSFCFADPYNLRSLNFATIQHLSQRFVDFMILIPSGMDANRNLVPHYLKKNNKIIDMFLGTSDWRDEWRSVSVHQSFDIFLTDYYGRNMQNLGYYYPGIESTQLIRSSKKNLPLYRLALFSRVKLGDKFWSETKKYSDPQLKLNLFD
jgi:three-Cys-motif partner protein